MELKLFFLGPLEGIQDKKKKEKAKDLDTKHAKANWLSKRTENVRVDKWQDQQRAINRGLQQCTHT